MILVVPFQISRFGDFLEDKNKMNVEWEEWKSPSTRDTRKRELTHNVHRSAPNQATCVLQHQQLQLLTRALDQSTHMTISSWRCSTKAALSGYVDELLRKIFSSLKEKKYFLSIRIVLVLCWYHGRVNWLWGMFDSKRWLFLGVGWIQPHVHYFCIIT